MVGDYFQVRVERGTKGRVTALACPLSEACNPAGYQALLCHDASLKRFVGKQALIRKTEGEGSAWKDRIGLKDTVPSLQQA